MQMQGGGRWLVQFCVRACASYKWRAPFSFCSSLMASSAGLLRLKPRCQGNAACPCELQEFHSLSYLSSPSLGLSVTLQASSTGPRTLSPFRSRSWLPRHLSAVTGPKRASTERRARNMKGRQSEHSVREGRAGNPRKGWLEL